MRGLVLFAFVMSLAASLLSTLGESREIYKAFGREASSKGFKYKVMIIDSGFSKPGLPHNVRLCPKGHLNALTGKEELPEDKMGHGTLVTKIAAFESNRKDVCFMIVKVFEPGYSPEQSYQATVKALRRAYAYGVTAINMSYEAKLMPYKLIEEYKMMRRLGRHGVRMFVASGNGGINLNEQCSVAPACYKDVDHMYVVGGISNDQYRANYSNYGSVVDLWAPGWVHTADGRMQQGTSFATPRALGIWLKGLPK